MGKSILIIEDERGIAETIVYALETDGFQVRWEKTGREGLAAAQSGNFDLVTLDVGLPDMTGFEVCSALRRDSRIPVFFLTARADEVDRVLGLELGADDYIVKPFSPRELSARIKALFRRLEAHELPDPASSNTPFTVVEDKFLIFFHGEPLELRRYEFGILKLLLGRPGRVYSRGQIMESVWDVPDMSLERTVDTHIKSIRQKMKVIRPGEDWVVTHRGIGYSIKEAP